MKNFLVRVVVALSGVMMSTLAFAQGEGGGANTGLYAIGAAIAIGLAAFGAASGQARASAAALEGIARNPSAKDTMFQPFILGLVIMEFQALLGFVIAILWTTKV